MSIAFLVDTSSTLSLLLVVTISFLLATVIFALSFLLAIQAPDAEKTSSYECGFEPFGDARNRFDVRFYVVAILFLIFDVEIAFLFPWATTLATTGLSSYGIVVAFLVLLTLGFLYEVRKGALNPQ
jgi:NADH-quinone oxidoreductase subunit A